MAALPSGAGCDANGLLLWGSSAVKPVFTATEMRALDARAIGELGIPGLRLMENAGRGATAVISRAFAPIRGKRVLVICGKGTTAGTACRGPPSEGKGAPESRRGSWAGAAR
jgi:hypothetical protein